MPSYDNDDGEDLVEAAALVEEGRGRGRRRRDAPAAVARDSGNHRETVLVLQLPTHGDDPHTISSLTAPSMVLESSSNNWPLRNNKTTKRASYDKDEGTEEDDDRPTSARRKPVVEPLPPPLPPPASSSPPPPRPVLRRPPGCQSFAAQQRSEEQQEDHHHPHHHPHPHHDADTAAGDKDDPTTTTGLFDDDHHLHRPGRPEEGREHGDAYHVPDVPPVGPADRVRPEPSPKPPVVLHEQRWRVWAAIIAVVVVLLLVVVLVGVICGAGKCTSTPSTDNREISREGAGGPPPTTAPGDVVAVSPPTTVPRDGGVLSPPTAPRDGGVLPPPTPPTPPPTPLSTIPPTIAPRTTTTAPTTTAPTTTAPTTTPPTTTTMAPTMAPTTKTPLTTTPPPLDFSVLYRSHAYAVSIDAYSADAAVVMFGGNDNDNDNNIVSVCGRPIRLAAITSADENAIITALGWNRSSSSSGEYLFLGGFQNRSIDETATTAEYAQGWSWLSTKEGSFPAGNLTTMEVDQTYANWAANEPDQRGGDDEDCLAIYTVDGMWHDRRCTDLLPIVLEVDLDQNKSLSIEGCTVLSSNIPDALVSVVVRNVDDDDDDDDDDNSYVCTYLSDAIKGLIRDATTSVDDAANLRSRLTSILDQLSDTLTPEMITIILDLDCVNVKPPTISLPFP